MKMKAFVLAAASCICLAAAPMTAMAADWIDEVYISLVSDEDLNDLAPETVYVIDIPSTPGGGDYWINNYNYSSGDIATPRRSYTLTMDVECDRDWEFTKDTEVSVYGSYEVSVSIRSSRRMTVKAKMYPFYKFPTAISASVDEVAKKATWDAVDYAKNYAVMIDYSQNGNERTIRKTTTSPSISLSSYIGGKNSVNSVSVVAIPGSSTADRYLASEGFDDEYGRYDFRVPTATRHGTQSDSSSSSGYSSGSGGPGTTAGSSGSTYTGWQGSGNTWYYLSGGIAAVGWREISRNEWYLFGSNGVMLTGWQNVGGRYYYMNTSHDGTYGKMLVGLQNINGRYYYFNENHDGTYGALYMNQYTPDGRYAGADGVIGLAGSSYVTNTQGPGSSGSSPNSGGPGVTNDYGIRYTGWQGSGDTWYYVVNGTRVTGWKEVSRDEWYLFSSSGLMLTGWQQVGGVYYFMNPNHDGTYGKMLTGYLTINGKPYYFNQLHDGYYGAMYSNRYAPNGKFAGGDGVLY